ncbi:MAG: hypothetical protein R3F43_30705 [bacterium]
MAHHAALRTHFAGGQRVVVPAATLPVLRYTVATDEARERIEEALASAPFAGPPLARLARVRQGRREHLVLTAHHAVVDGWSAFLLAQRLWTLYADPEAPAPGGRGGRGRRRRRAGWRRRAGALATAAGVAGGPPDAPRTARIARLVEVAAVQRRAAALGVTPFALIAAAWARALGAWAGLDVVVLNVATGGRDAGTAEVVGCRADTVPLAVAVAGAGDDVARRVAAAWPQAARQGGNARRSGRRAPDGGPGVPSPFGLSVALFRGRPRRGGRRGRGGPDGDGGDAPGPHGLAGRRAPRRGPQHPGGRLRGRGPRSAGGGASGRAGGGRGRGGREAKPRRCYQTKRICWPPSPRWWPRRPRPWPSMMAPRRGPMRSSGGAPAASPAASRASSAVRPWRWTSTGAWTRWSPCWGCSGSAPSGCPSTPTSRRRARSSSSPWCGGAASRGTPDGPPPPRVVLTAADRACVLFTSGPRGGRRGCR